MVEISLAVGLGFFAGVVFLLAVQWVWIFFDKRRRMDDFNRSFEAFVQNVDWSEDGDDDIDDYLSGGGLSVRKLPDERMN